MSIVLLLLASLLFSLQFKPVQTFVAKRAAKYLSKELKTRVEVESLYIKPFKSLVLEGLLIEDHEKDTLLYSPRFTVDLNLLSFDERIISVNTVQMDNGKFFLKQYKDTTTNLEFIINYFDTGTTKPRVKPRKPYDITFDKIVLNNIAFKYKNFNSNTLTKQVNFNDISLYNLNGIIQNLDTKNHLVKADFKNLTFREKTGFYLKNLTTSATIDTNQMEFKNLVFETPNTRISDYLLFKYNKFTDFGKFVDKIYLKANFKSSRIYSPDFAYFNAALDNSFVDLKLDGSVSGFVNDLKTKNLSIKTGKATYLKGDFNIKGLPNLKTAYIDLNLHQAYTNKQDLDYIISKATGKKKSILPPIISKFGNVSFKGKFKGFTKNFNASGDFKTKLGRIISNVNFKFNNNGTPSYNGLVKTYDFNLGELLGKKNLGRTTLSANINGSGFKINQLHEQIKSKIAYFDFQGYRYHNIAVNGIFANKVFNGKVNVNDRNVKLNFIGGVNLNPTYPVYNFNAVINKANLRALHFTKDTVQIDAKFRANFSGNNLDNIQGNFDINRIRLTNTTNSFVVDSVTLAAKGIGDTRSLVINSDILDASLKGKYDLQTLPSYFKSLVKRYIPSMQIAVGKFKPQNFEIALNLKYFEPLSLLFLPDLKIPEQANINGRFISNENLATVNGSAKLIQYKNIKINNLIIDESTTQDAMNLFIASDRVDLTENLYVKNVNIANILSKDSLNLNIKLSDKDAINQLDLNGLVEFNSKTFASLSILPSDIVINREVWKIQEKVKIGFDKGRTSIENFELFRNNQLLTINGVISTNPKDELLLGFNNFNLTTFNPLSQASGISLKGELNGNAKLSSIGKTPKIEADIKVDSLNFNNVAIGDLTMNAELDNSTRLINVKIDIINQGQKTLNVEGTYNANADKNNLDMNVKMNNNEVIIFEPFIKNLVSNLKGKVSADLNVTGPLLLPKINGTLTLINAGMTVNYLKTPYTINDDATVENSVIRLENLILKDLNDNAATANGTVDMSNPLLPVIDINLVAFNFMALNTTVKDNPLYYGTAYGTGVFTFNGPTNNMRINIDAKTEAGTVFNIPFNSSATIKDNDFIVFVAKDSLLNNKKETSFNGLTMSFDLVVDENSEVNIITDLGKLTGRGKANLDLNITSLGDFEMFGDYQISEGKFAYTAQDYINKIFKINQGGSIRWAGNPAEAVINLQAVYAVRTSLKNIYLAAGRPATDQQVLAEAIMNLNGLLLNPGITFDLNFPTDANVEDELQSYLSDVNNTNQQALNLIVRRTFVGPGDADLNLVNTTIVSVGTELLFNQLNTVIAQTFPLNFVDFNIRSLNEASASFRFLKDRLILTGGVTSRNFGSGDFQEFRVLSGDVARDVEALYLIKKDGSLVFRASNRLINRNLLNNNTKEAYVNALGLVYRKDFDNGKELLSILLGKKRREERQKKKMEMEQKPITNPVDPKEAKSKQTTAAPK